MNYGLTGKLLEETKEYPQWIVGRVTLQERDIYTVITEKGEITAKVSGKFRFNVLTVSDYPAVGDFVMIAEEEGEGQNIIHKVLTRKSVFVRKAAGSKKNEQVVAANVDIIFLCMSLNNDYNLRRLERYLSIAWDSGATPVIVLTKSDLCDDLDEVLLQVQEVAIGVDVVVCSSYEKTGINDVLPYIKEGKTAAFIGSSGVGKSTLINALIGEELIKTSGLRNDDKGRHTTTHRELIVLNNGGMVIDTPGMRELGMWDVEEGFDKAFSDIAELASQCKFNDCRHESEPGCAIKRALESGELSAERWNSYKKLLVENAYAEDAKGYLEAKKKKFMEIAKMNRKKK